MKTATLTSLPPSMSRLIDGQDYGRAIMQETIDRWSLCTDKLYSFNTAEEALSLAGLVTGVEIVAVEGNERVSVSAMAEFARQENYDTIVISNADCIPIDIKIMRDMVLATQPNELRILRRSNLRTSDLIASREVFHGIDTFVLGKDAIATIPTTAQWKIGDPVWDIWLPLFLLSKGIKLRGTGAYLLAHIDHETRWFLPEWESNARKLLTELPLNGPAFSPHLRGLHADRIPHVSKLEIQQKFDEIAEFLFTCESSTSSGEKSFNMLWLSILQAQFGPQDRNFLRYTRASGKPISRWFIKNFPWLFRWSE